MKLPDFVVIKEVGPRDGLQNEKKIVGTNDKLEWIHLLSDTGLSYIEVSSFVHPKWIPALADATDVFANLERKADITYAALVPNERGLQRALAANVDEVSVFLSASETHNRSNINTSVADALKSIKEVTAASLQAGKKVRGYISTVFGCPFEGPVSISAVMELCEELLSYGIYEISLGDTIGVANPLQVEQVLESLLDKFPASSLALHFHNTYGMALANVLQSLVMGITTFDSACGGLGGCPYAPGASGNIATNDLIHMLHSMGVQTNIDEDRFMIASQFIERKLDIPLNSHVLHAKQQKAKMG
ncbi:hydroxymethylglutaryl-CoA lyase [Ectobacillus polymachus]|uniref:hydroxymethylglutaryl-CoA lyase n=1 Tax=Ectobacillus polymachus TaxID=1508806 RepID=UPI003A8389CA